MTSYFAYLASPEWDQRRKVEYDKAKGICLGCGNKAKNIHHRTYARLGHEAEGDLVALCKHCHLLAHLRYEEHPRTKLWDATNAVIRSQRELFGLPPIPLPREDGTVEPAGEIAVKTVRPKPQPRSGAERRSKGRQKRWERFFAKPPRVRLTLAEIEAARTPAGGWTRKQMAAWGVPWPPPRGWKVHLTGADSKKGESNAA